MSLARPFMKFRKNPQIGEVIAVPLKNDEWVYLCFAMFDSCYLYSLISKGGLVSADKLLSFKRLATLHYGGRLPVTFRTIYNVQLSESDAYPWSLVKFIDDEGDDCLKMTDGKTSRPATEEELQRLGSLRLYNRCSWDDEKSLTAFAATIEAHRPQMELIQVDASTGATLEKAEPETAVQFGVLELLDETGSISYDITEAAAAAGLGIDECAELVWNGQASESDRFLKIIRKIIQRDVPQEDCDSIEIYRSGPGKDEVHNFKVRP